MKNLRTYGRPPFRVAVVHGGPGAAGEMAPVARELAMSQGVLEPLQTAASVAGQVEELKATLEEMGDLPITLIGYSWGAWLSLLLTADHPACVKKVILIGCGPLEEKYLPRLQETRLSRLSEEERAEYQATIKALSDPAAGNKDSALERLGALAFKTDSYDPVLPGSNENGQVDAAGDVFHNVWKEAAELRRNGKLLEFVKQVRCPVVAIHGDYDPHPAAGVQEPLNRILEKFRFILLPSCGHTPWLERQAREAFYRALKEELG